MKKLLMFLFSFFILLICGMISVRAESDNIEIVKDAKTAILIEPSTFTILYEKNAKEKRAPASLTKIMTLILIMESLADGTISLDEMVVTSQRAKDITGSRILLDVGEQMSVEDLIKGIAIGSGNDAAIVMAERIGQTEENFAKMMNHKAAEIGAVNTQFKNSHGLDEEGHFSCAYDMALFSAYLINNYEEKIIPYTSCYEDYLRKDSNNPFWLVNPNRLVHFIDGYDGLKSGFTDNAKYCLSGTMKENNTRFISITMGNSSAKMRNFETMELLEYAFRNFEVLTIFKKGEVVSNVNDLKISPRPLNVVTSRDVNFIKKKYEQKKDIRHDIVLDIDKINALSNSNIGTLKLYYDNDLVSEVDLDIVTKVKKTSFLKICWIVLKEILLVSK